MAKKPHNESAKAFRDAFKRIESKSQRWRSDLILAYTLWSLSQEGFEVEAERGSVPSAEEAEAFRELLELHRAAMTEHPHDLLGSLYMGGDKRGKKGYTGNAHAGQFFTEPAVAEAMARLSLTELYSGRLKNGGEQKLPIKILEPSAGMGAILLGYAAVLEEFDLAAGEIVFTAIELMAGTYYGLALQLHLAGLNAQVYNGNSVTGEVFGQLRTGAPSAARRVKPSELHPDTELGGLFAA